MKSGNTKRCVGSSSSMLYLQRIQSRAVCRLYDRGCTTVRSGEHSYCDIILVRRAVFRAPLIFGLNKSRPP